MVSLNYDVERAALLSAYDEIRARCYAPLSTVTPVEFAQTVMRMPDTHGATQPFSFGYAPYQREPYEQIFHPRHQELALMWASRLGKSRIVLTALGYVIVERPCRIGVMWPVEGDGKLWSKDDFMGELVEPTPQIAALIENGAGQRKTANTLLNKKFPGGLLQILGSNAPGRARRIKARFLYGDEIDAIQGNLSDEGDMLKIFAKRGDEYPDTIQVYCSYPSLKGRSRIEAKLEGSDYRQWFVTCLLCGGEPFVMHRSQLVYDEPHVAETRLQCPRCQGHLTDLQRYAMMMGGDPAHPRFDLWRATRPYTGKAGYHANSLLWPHPVDPAKFPGGYLQMLAQKALDAERAENPEKARRVIINTEDAETFEAACDAKPDHSQLYLRREKYDPEILLPESVLMITFGADLQKDRAELFFIGWGEKSQSWAVAHWVIKGDPLDPAFWEEIDRRLLRASWKHPSGLRLTPRSGFFDCGYLRDKVLGFTRPRARRKIFASFGSTSLARAIVGRPKREGKPPAFVYELGTNEAKDILYQRLELDNPAAVGYKHYPETSTYGEAYFKQLTVEDSEMRKANDGEYYRAFTCPEGVRNEALDGEVYALAAERMLRRGRKESDFYARLRAGLPKPKGPPPDPGAAPAPADPPPPPVVTPPTAAKPIRRFPVALGRAGGKGFVQSWRR